MCNGFNRRSNQMGTMPSGNQQSYNQMGAMPSGNQQSSNQSGNPYSHSYWDEKFDFPICQNTMSNF